MRRPSGRAANSRRCSMRQPAGKPSTSSAGNQGGHGSHRSPDSPEVPNHKKTHGLSTRWVYNASCHHPMSCIPDPSDCTAARKQLTWVLGVSQNGRPSAHGQQKRHHEVAISKHAVQQWRTKMVTPQGDSGQDWLLSDALDTCGHSLRVIAGFLGPCFSSFLCLCVCAYSFSSMKFA